MRRKTFDKIVTFVGFGLSVFLEDKSGQQVLYTIEHENGFYTCFVQRKGSKGSRWKEKRLVESSKKSLRFEYSDNNESGFMIERK